MKARSNAQRIDLERLNQELMEDEIADDVTTQLVLKKARKRGQIVPFVRPEMPIPGPKYRQRIVLERIA